MGEGQIAEDDGVAEVGSGCDAEHGVAAVARQGDASPGLWRVAGVDTGQLDRLLTDDESLVEVGDLVADIDDVRAGAVGEGIREGILNAEVRAGGTLPHGEDLLRSRQARGGQPEHHEPKGPKPTSEPAHSPPAHVKAVGTPGGRTASPARGSLPDDARFRPGSCHRPTNALGRRPRECSLAIFNRIGAWPRPGSASGSGEALRKVEAEARGWCHCPIG